MKANKIRIFTGTLAAIALMTGMTPAITFAQEADNTAIPAANNAEEQMLKSQQNASKDRKETETKEFNTHRRQNGEEVIEKIIYYDNGDYDEIYYLKNSGTIVEFYAFRQETDPGANVDTTVFDTRAKAYSAEQLKADIDGKSVDEIFTYLLSLSTANANNAKEGAAEEKLNETSENGVENDILSFLDDEGKSIVSAALNKAMNALPYGDFYSGPIEDLLKETLGLEEKKTAIQEVINNNHSEELKKLDELFKKRKQNSTNCKSLAEYGKRLDDFHNDAKLAADAMLTVTEKRTDLTEKEKAVHIAAIIGNEYDWAAGNIDLFNSMALAAQSLRGNPKTDPNGRNMYQVIYDFNKDYSMFSGESMDRSEAYIQERIKEYTKNCAIAIQCLKAHETVAKLTETDVANMNKKTQNLYHETISSMSSINAKIKKVTAIFTGNKTADKSDEKMGIFDRMTDYYNTSRTIFLNRNTKNIELDNRLDAVGAAELGVWEKSYDPEIHERANNYLKSQALSTDEIKAIYEHCVNNKWTIAEYLRKVGFDLGSLNQIPNCNGGMLIDGETYNNNKLMGYFEEGTYGYQIYGNNGRQKCFTFCRQNALPFYDEKNYNPAKDQYTEEGDMALITFRTPGQDFYRDTFNDM